MDAHGGRGPGGAGRGARREPHVPARGGGGARPRQLDRRAPALLRLGGQLRAGPRLRPLRAPVRGGARGAPRPAAAAPRPRGGLRRRRGGLPRLGPRRRRPLRAPQGVHDAAPRPEARRQLPAVQERVPSVLLGRHGGGGPQEPADAARPVRGQREPAGGHLQPGSQLPRGPARRRAGRTAGGARGARGVPRRGVPARARPARRDARAAPAPLRLAAARRRDAGALPGLVQLVLGVRRRRRRRGRALRAHAPPPAAQRAVPRRLRPPVRRARVRRHVAERRLRLRAGPRAAPPRRVHPLHGEGAHLPRPGGATGHTHLRTRQRHQEQRAGAQGGDQATLALRRHHRRLHEELHLLQEGSSLRRPLRQEQGGARGDGGGVGRAPAAGALHPEELVGRRLGRGGLRAPAGPRQHLRGPLAPLLPAPRARRRRPPLAPPRPPPQRAITYVSL